MRFLFLLAFGLLAISMARAESDHEFYLGDGSPVALQWLTDQMIVQASPGTAPEALDRVVRRQVGPALRRADVEEADRQLRRLDLGTSLTAAAWHKQAAALQADPAVRGVYPVFAHPPFGHKAAMTDELIVRLKEGSTPEQLAAAPLPHAFEVIEREPYDPRIVRLRLAKPTSFGALELANHLFQTGAVQWAEPNFILEIRREFAPNDPSYNRQWQLNNYGQTFGTPDADVDAPEAWDTTQGDPAIMVAIIDDGINIDHVDLAGNIYVNPLEIAFNGIDDDGNGYIDDVNGWDFLNWDNNPRGDNPSDTDPGDFHGTPCAGMAVARGNNGIGIASTAFNCRLLPCRILGATTGASISNVASAIQYAGTYASVMSMSWTTMPNNTITAAIQSAATSGRGGKGCLVFAATGNEYTSTSVGFPARNAYVMGIGASTARDTRASYSNYAYDPDAGTFAVAPGDNTYTLSTLGAYRSFSGTSAASPMAAGVAALMLSANPNLTRTEAHDILAVTADKVDTVAAQYNVYGYSRSHGYGRLNVQRAVLAAVPQPPDLAPVGFDFSPAAVAVGGRLNLSGAIHNYSSGASAPAWLEFWLSANTSFARLDFPAIPAFVIPALAPGGEYRFETIVADLFPTIPDGYYRLGVIVDRPNSVAETNETNNMTYVTNKLLQIGGGSTQVDLVVENFDYQPSKVLPGQPLQFSGTIVNHGPQISRDVWVEFFAQRNMGGGVDLHYLCLSANIGPLGFEQAFDLATLNETVFGPPDLPLGKYSVWMAVDRFAQQPELNEANNSAYVLNRLLTVGNITSAGAWSLYR